MPAKCSLRAALLLCIVGFALLPGVLAAQLSAVHSQLWQQGAEGVPGESEQNDKFGSGLAAGDFDGDGFADLAIGVPGEDFAIPPDGFRTDAGSLTVLYGTRDGLASGRAQVWSQANLLLQGSPEDGDEWATTLATGDFDGDGYDDLAIGAPYHDDGAEERTGEIQILYGSASGLGSSGNQSFSTFFFSAEWTGYLQYWARAGRGRLRRRRSGRSRGRRPRCFRQDRFRQSCDRSRPPLLRQRLRPRRAHLLE